MIIVTGITRSGLSLTMQMLYAGGYPCAGESPAFEKYSMGQIPWMEHMGQIVAVKHVDGHRQLPPRMWLNPFNVIRLHRNMGQQAASYNKFNDVVIGLPAVPIDRLVKSFRRDYGVIDRYFRLDRVLDLHFEHLLGDPLGQAERIVEWCDPGDPPEMDVDAMAEAVVPRGPECFDGMLELELMQRYKTGNR